MELLVAYQDDPAGHNMAKFLSKEMTMKDDGTFHGDFYDLAIISTPAISADWLEEKYDYDGFIFLSKHAAESGVLALTCHSTGNFSSAKFGGNDRQVAVPKPDFQKSYLQTLKKNQSQFSDFQVTIEATHHGPTALTKPSIFVEIGTTEKQWTDVSLCSSVASLVHQVMSHPIKEHPVAICFGGTHYPTKFTRELLEGAYSLGTVIPKHALADLDESLFSHVLEQNSMAKAALLDWKGLGSHKQKVLELLGRTDLEVVKLLNLQQKIFKKLLEVPKGQLTTYGELAKSVGLKNGQRAVGKIMNKNPYPVIIPCHRVVMSTGKIGGYAYGEHVKTKMLNDEGIQIQDGKIVNLKDILYRF